MIHQVDEEVSSIYKDQSETGTELNESQANDSSNTLSYSLGNSVNGSADQSHQVDSLGLQDTVLDQDQQTTTVENSSNSDSPIPPTQFTFSEPSHQTQTQTPFLEMLGENSSSLNSPPQSMPKYSFAEPAVQDQYSPVSDRVACSISPVQSQSLLPQAQTPLNWDTNDRFNGILYHVYAHDGYTTIVFSSKDLFNKFMGAIEKELHPQQISDVRANYNTHIRGKWCTITSDTNFGTLTLNGPGCKLWRETVFIRLAYHLYQQFKSETDADLNGSIFAQPLSKFTGLHSASPQPMSPVLPPAVKNVDLQMQVVTSISHEIHELKKKSQLLTEQVIAINGKIDTLLKMKTKELQTSVSSSNSFVTISEASGDTTRLSPGPRSYSEVLDNHTSTPESNNKSGSVEIINHNSDNNMDNINSNATSQAESEKQTENERNCGVSFYYASIPKEIK